MLRGAGQGDGVILDKEREGASFAVQDMHFLLMGGQEKGNGGVYVCVCVCVCVCLA